MPISNPKSNVVVAQDDSAYIIWGKQEVDITSSAAVIVVANEDRKGLTIFNHHSNDVYFDVQETVNETAFMFLLTPGDFYEMPQPVFSDAIYAKCQSGTGKLSVRQIIRL